MVESNEITEVAERCAKVIDSWKSKKVDSVTNSHFVNEHGLKMISDFAWALGIDLEVKLLDKNKDIGL